MPNDFYVNKNSELDMRKELIDTLDGTGVEISKKQHFLLRKMRKDSNGKFITCTCVDEVTKEADRDFFCPFCYGEKYLWDESWITGYKFLLTNGRPTALNLQLRQMGLLDVQTCAIWFRYSESISNDDKIIELNLDKDGNVPQNPLRVKVWRINILDELRLDEGRVESLKAYCSQEDIRFLNPPTE